jgi:hypothetical protein
MTIKDFKSFESMYSAAARLAPQYTKPVSNDEYRVSQVLITFPDTTQLLFDIYSENYNSDTINYKLQSNTDRLQSLYINLYGDAIQMEDYQEFVFVRCWNNPGDFISNNWSGYIFHSDKDGPFYEIDMKFGIAKVYSSNNTGLFDNEVTYTKEYFKNQYFDRYTLSILLSHYNTDLPNGITYNKLMGIKKKIESWLLDQSGDVNLYNVKFDGIPLLSLMYALHLKDRPFGKSVLKEINLSEVINSNGIISVEKLLDLLFPN